MAKWLVRTQEQLVPVNLFLLSVKRPVHLQEQLVLPLFSIRQVTSSCPRTACASFVFCQPSNQFVSKNSLCFLLFSFSQVTSSNTRAACALCCQYSRSSGQFASKNSLYLSNLLSSLPSESCYLLPC